MWKERLECFPARLSPGDRSRSARGISLSVSLCGCLLNSVEFSSLGLASNVSSRGEFTDNVERTLGMLPGPTLTWRPKPVSPRDKPKRNTGMDQA